MNAKALIRKKREGSELSEAEIAWLVESHSSGDVPDYQMSAFLMAVLWRGMTADETAHLTGAMVRSGRTLAFPGLSPLVDKHSTGGVGDKVSLILAPLAASAGLYVPMLSGRGLGHTGGTLDKLESIPGFETRLAGERFERVLRDVGCVMGGQSGDLAPADGRLYALRDATSTVESLPLIVSSILSKKIAAGPDALVLDVKVGRGAFMADLDRARALGKGLVETGARFGKRVLAFITDMNAPLGRAVGNRIEVVESVMLLRNEPVAPDLRELSLVLTAAMLVLSGRCITLGEARVALESLLGDGRALTRFGALVRAQGGDAEAVLDQRFGRDVTHVPVHPERAGIVTDVDPLAVAHAVVSLGGGRHRMTDDVDPVPGVWIDRKPGERADPGEPVLTVHVRKGARVPDAELGALRSAVTVGDAAPSPVLIHEVIGETGAVPWNGWDTPLPVS